jgi:hypothetical protein
MGDFVIVYLVDDYKMGLEAMFHLHSRGVILVQKQTSSGFLPIFVYFSNKKIGF